MQYASLAVATLVFAGTGQMSMAFLRGREQFYSRVVGFFMLLFTVATSWYLYGLFSTGMATSVKGDYVSVFEGHHKVKLAPGQGNSTYPADFGICE